MSSVKDPEQMEIAGQLLAR